MAAHHPSASWRRSLRTLALVFGALVIGMLVSFWLYGHRVQLRALAGERYGGFTPVLDFPLRDSLPALEGGLSNLEAFKVTTTPSWRADAERSLWISDSLGTLKLEFVSEKEPFDSVTLFAWWTGGTLKTRTFPDGGGVVWNLFPNLPVNGWLESVSAYISDPPLFRVSSLDTAITLFERAEGKVFHVIEGWYLGRRSKSLRPDTSYFIAAKGEGLSLMVRGDALAVVNPTLQKVTLRLVETGSNYAEVVAADSSSVSVYRGLMRQRIGTMLAYTDPGRPYPVFRVSEAEPQDIFVLRR